MSDEPSADDVVMGVAWYKPGDWERLEELCPDLKGIWQSYEQWRTATARKMSQARMSGRRVEKVEVDPEDLLAWCKRQDRTEIDSAARAEYAADKLRERYGQ